MQTLSAATPTPSPPAPAFLEDLAKDRDERVLDRLRECVLAQVPSELEALGDAVMMLGILGADPEPAWVGYREVPLGIRVEQLRVKPVEDARETSPDDEAVGVVAPEVAPIRLIHGEVGLKSALRPTDWCHVPGPRRRGRELMAVQ